MKDKDDTYPNDASVVPFSLGLIGRTSSAPDASSLSSFLHQEQLCKELYLSMGVHSSDVADTSDDDVASILEQMSKFHPSGQDSATSGDRNIEDILREAESLLDGQQASLPTRPNTSTISSRSGSGASNSFLHPGPTNLHKEDKQSFKTNEQTSAHQKHLNATPSIHSSVLNFENDLEAGGDHSGQPYQAMKRNQKGCETFVPAHVVGTPLEVTYKRIYEQIRKEVDGSLEPHLTGDFPDLKLSLPIPGLDTPAYDVPGCFNLEQEFLEERKRCLKLKADLDWLKRQHEREVSDLRHHHEDQLNQVREELRNTSHQTLDSSVVTLQNELKAKEQIISQYHQENEKMCTEINDMKRLLLKLMALLKTDNDSVCVFP